MIRALCWKEYRVHRTSWLLMVVVTVAVACGVGVALPLLGGPGWQRRGELSQAVAGLMVGMASFYGLLCGALLLTGEHEARLMDFLDRLPVTRSALWKAKVLIGAGFTLGQAALLAALALLVGSLERAAQPPLAFVALPLLALDGLAWGLAASVLCRSTALAFVCALALQAVAWLAAFFVAWLSGIHPLAVRAVFFWAAPLLSWLAFCEPDRSRDAALRPHGGPNAASTWHVLLWLAVRQGGLGAAVATAVALLLALSNPPLWGLGVLLVGIVFGGLVFAGQKKGGRYRFIGEHWLSAGWAWLLRTACWLIGAATVSAAVLLGALAVSKARAQRWGRSATPQQILENVLPEGLFADLGPWAALALLLACGFSAGQVTAPLPRRRLLAILLAPLLAAALLAPWLPSLLLGGLAMWPVLVPPVVLLAVVGLTVPGRSGGLLARRPVAVRLGGAVLAVLWIAGGLWYRVVEIPGGEPFDRAAFEATLPPRDNEPGALFQELADGLDEHLLRVSAAVGPPRRPPAPAPPGFPWPFSEVDDAEGIPPPPADPIGQALGEYQTLLQDALTEGWPKDAVALGKWLDAVFAENWAEPARRAAVLPLGLVRDPRGVTAGTPVPEAFTGRPLAELFVGRALQLQARGRDAEALEQFVTVLGLSRQLRHKTPMVHLLMAHVMERIALSGLDQWQQHLGRQPGLLRRAANALRRHEELRPPVAENVKADYYGFSQDLRSAGDAGPGALMDPSLSWDLQRLQRRLYLLARDFPWEKERGARQAKAFFRRLLARCELPPWEVESKWERRLTNLSDPTSSLSQPALEMGLPRLSPRAWGPLLTRLALLDEVDMAAYNLALLRGARLQLALALHQVEEGKPAQALADLIPRHLPEGLIDPFSGRAFRYRVSGGERIALPPDELGTPRFREVAAGQGVVWRVGPDRKDDGGIRQGRNYPWGYTQNRANLGLDLIFVIPRLSKN